MTSSRPAIAARAAAHSASRTALTTGEPIAVTRAAVKIVRWTGPSATGRTATCGVAVPISAGSSVTT